MNFKNYIENTIPNYFYKWKKLELGWLIIATIGIIVATFLGWDSSYESASLIMQIIIAIGSITGTWCVILVSKQRLSNYFFGLLNVIAFGIMYIYFQMPGMALVNLVYFLPLQFIGFYQWFKKQEKIDIVAVKWATTKQRIIILSITIISSIIMYQVLGYYNGISSGLGVGLPISNESLRWLDSIGTIGNAVAQILMNLALIDQWVFWWIIDLTQTIAFGILVFVEHDSYALSMFIMYIIWLINAVWGFISWIKNNSKRENKADLFASVQK